MLCEKCSGITIKALRFGYQHVSSFKSLKSSAISCSLCAILWNGVVTHAGCEPCRKDLLRIQEKPIVLMGGSDESLSTISYVNISSHGEDDEFSMEGRLFGRVSLYVLPDSLAASLIRGRHVIVDMESDANFQVLGSWIRACGTDHQYCPRLPTSVLEHLPMDTTSPVLYSEKQTPGDIHEQTASPLPTHVIDVGPRDGCQEPYLLNTVAFPRKDYFITLSHCWGGKQPLMTTMSNYRERVRSIPMASLPQTFRDAVKITRRLGIRYLWIDSLCILQDVEEDWRLQSMRMGDYYARSFLTINAAGSPDSEGGCFFKTSSLENLECVIRPMDSPADIYVSKYIEEFTFDDRGYTGSRAWCVQETVLPNRVVTYGKRMMAWLCETKSMSQQGRRVGKSGLRMESAWRICGDALDHQRWAFIVTNYTKRSLTFERDKLVALSGLAELCGTVLKDEYLAGLWLKDLVDGLLWSVMENEPATRPANYRAPSWSWASLEGPISMKISRSPKESVVVKVIDWHIDNQGDDIFGGISGGMLTLRGPFAKVTYLEGFFLIWQTPSGNNQSDLKGVVESNEISTAPCSWMDCAFGIPGEKDWPSTSLWCLAINTGGVQNPFQHSLLEAKAAADWRQRIVSTTGWGLLLMSTGNSDEYLRVGVARVEFSAFAGCSEQTVFLI